MNITLIRKVDDIDNCIVEEIEKLYNVHEINTIYSCCGHGYKVNSQISVLNERDVYKMKELGYEYNPDLHGYFASFFPKSECKCKKKSLIHEYNGLQISIDVEHIKKCIEENKDNALKTNDVCIVTEGKTVYMDFETFLKKLEII